MQIIEMEEDTQSVAAAERLGLESSVREAHAVAARYDAATGDLALILRGGAQLRVATQLLQGVAGAAPEQIERVELWGNGSGLHWEELDADLRVQDIVAGSFGTQRWMAQLEAQGLLDEASIKRRQQVAELTQAQQQDQVQRAAAAMGRIGGAARTRSKVEAARANGAKGGRPRKVSLPTNDSTQRVGREIGRGIGKEVGSDIGNVIGVEVGSVVGVIGVEVGSVMGRGLNDFEFSDHGVDEEPLVDEKSEIVVTAFHSAKTMEDKSKR